MSYGLALSGGGARGAAHVGVLLALEEENLLPDYIAGTSSGSIVASCFASGIEPQELKQIVKKMSKNGMQYLDPDILGLLLLIPQLLLQEKVSLSGILKGHKLHRYFCQITEDKRLEDITFPLLVPAVDLISGDTICFTNMKSLLQAKKISRKDNKKEIEDKTEYQKKGFKDCRCEYLNGVESHLVRWVEKGSLCDIMMASSSVPGVFKPFGMNGCCLVDGGVTDNLPVDLLIAAGAKRVIAVDIGSDYEMPEEDSVFEILSHSFSIMSRSLKECRSQGERLLLNPQIPKKAGLLTFEYMEACMEAGYLSAKKNMKKIRNVVKEK